MSFDILLGLSVFICLVGIAIRISHWFHQSIDPSIEKVPLSTRISKALSGIFSVLFSSKLFTVIQSLFVDLIIQKRIIDKSTLRWITHACIFFGFVLVFFTHAVGNFTLGLFGEEYIPTLNPSLTWRNILGMIALVGVVLAVYRRISLRKQRLKTYLSDWIALLFVGIIMVSGFMLEGTKMSSYSVYQGMVEEYGDYEGEEAQALEAYWVAENGLASPHFTNPIESELVETGKELNQNGSCIECHASNKNAFISYSLSKIAGPVASALGDQRTVQFLWFLHILSCLGFLAWLPFSKMFHIVSAPVSLIINRVMGKTGDDPVNVLNRQMIGLSACTHCGACTVECSAMMFYESFQNDFILPSEKIQYLKRIAAGKEVDDDTLNRLQKGLYICTSCDRCTDICPSGINLRDIFISSRYALLGQGKPETSLLSHFSFPLSLVQKFTGNHLKALKAVHDEFKSKFISLPSFLGPITLSKKKGIDNTTYRSCYSCQRCTNICPVVRSYEDPGEALGMMPHQIIFSLGVGNVDLAMGAQMIWSCSTCYLCQEHCPNQVELTDIFYRLKNIAINKIEAGDN